MSTMFEQIIAEIRRLFHTEGAIALHEPRFIGNEKKYVLDCIDSTFVSSVGRYVGLFEQKMAEYTRIKYGVATTNGTSALHAALLLVGVDRDSIVLTQSLTFVATANAISYCGAVPAFIDSSARNLGLCPEKLADFLKTKCTVQSGGTVLHKETKKIVKACVPMNVFGHPANISEILKVCKQYNIPVIEDCAESLGSYDLDGLHTGAKSDLAIFSFNGNKIVTSGGGGMILGNDELLAQRAKHLTTTAKAPHGWNFFHDQVGYNYRLPNINAALAVAQLETLPSFLEKKRVLANSYDTFFKRIGVGFIKEPTGCRSNYWLNGILLKDRKERDEFLSFSNQQGVMTRPTWCLMHKLPAFQECPRTEMTQAEIYEDCIVNIPSSVIL